MLNSGPVTDVNLIKLLNQHKDRDIRKSLSEQDKDFPDVLDVPKDDVPEPTFFGKSRTLRGNKSYASLTEYLGAIRCSNALLYFPHSRMNWHTNSTAPGKRIYFTYSFEPSKFLYIDNLGRVQESYDIVKTWTFRKFEIKETDLFWHSILTKGFRLSYGFECK